MLACIIPLLVENIPQNTYIVNILQRYYLKGSTGSVFDVVFGLKLEYDGVRREP
jgi:hypothetical protein